MKYDPYYDSHFILASPQADSDFIGELETREGIRYKRYGSIMGWWDEGIEFYS
jgi:hypothetical protein